MKQYKQVGVNQLGEPIFEEVDSSNIVNQVVNNSTNLTSSMKDKLVKANPIVIGVAGIVIGAIFGDVFGHHN